MLHRGSTGTTANVLSSLHPFVLYHVEDDTLKSISLCSVSNALHHKTWLCTHFNRRWLVMSKPWCQLWQEYITLVMVLQVGTKTIKISAICSCTLGTSVCWMALLWKNFTWWCLWDDEMQSCWSKSAGHHYWLSSDSYWPVPVVPETHLAHQIYLGEPKRNCSRWPATQWKIPQSTENSRDDKSMLLLCSYWSIIQEDHQLAMILSLLTVYISAA